jgi:O-antigen ligase
VQLSIRHKKLFALSCIFFLFFLAISTWYHSLLPAFIPFIFLLVPAIIKRPVLLFYLLLIAIPLSTEYKFTDTLGTDFPDEFLMITATVIFILMITNDPSLPGKKLFRHLLFALLLIHFCWILVCTVYSTNVLLSVKYVLAKIWYIIAFVLLPPLFLKTKRSILIAAWCLLVPMLLIAFTGMLRHAAVGFSFEKINSTLTPFFRNHVNYGAMLVCMLPVATAAIYLSKHKSGRHWAILAFLIFLPALILSYSRGAWLSVIVALMAIGAVKKNAIHWMFLSIIILITIFAVWLANNNKYLDFRPDFAKTIFHTDFQQHLAATYHGRDLSTAERFYRWTSVKNLVVAKPLTGVGPNNFYDNYKPFATAVFKTYVSDNKEHSTVHNYFLLLLTEQGIVGVVIFTALLFGMFWYLQKIYHDAQDAFYKTFALTITAILAMIVTVNSLSDLIETDKIGSLFFLCLGCILTFNSQQVEIPVS